MYNYKVVRWTCPVCKHGNTISIDLESDHSTGYVNYCDEENGGCGRRMVVDILIRIDAHASRVMGAEEKEE